eukprot:gene10019-6996_t
MCATPYYIISVIFLVRSRAYRPSEATKNDIEQCWHPSRETSEPVQQQQQTSRQAAVRFYILFDFSLFLVFNLIVMHRAPLCTSPEEERSRRDATRTLRAIAEKTQRRASGELPLPTHGSSPLLHTQIDRSALVTCVQAGADIMDICLPCGDTSGPGLPVLTHFIYSGDAEALTESYRAEALQELKACVAAGATVTFFYHRDRGVRTPIFSRLLRRGEVAAVLACLDSPGPMDFTAANKLGESPLHLLAGLDTLSDDAVREILQAVIKRLREGREQTRDTVNWSQKTRGGLHCLSMAAAHQRLSLFWPIVQHEPAFVASPMIVLTDVVWEWDWAALGVEQQQRFRKDHTRFHRGSRSSAQLWQLLLRSPTDMAQLRRCLRDGADVMYKIDYFPCPILSACIWRGSLGVCSSLILQCKNRLLPMAGGTLRRGRLALVCPLQSPSLSDRLIPEELFYNRFASSSSPDDTALHIMNTDIDVNACLDPTSRLHCLCEESKWRPSTEEVRRCVRDGATALSDSMDVQVSEERVVRWTPPSDTFLDAVRCCVSSGANLQTMVVGDSMLSWGIQAGSLALVRCLLESPRGTDFSVSSAVGDCVLHTVVTTQNGSDAYNRAVMSSVVDRLLQRRSTDTVKWDQQNGEGLCFLSVAANNQLLSAIWPEVRRAYVAGIGNPTIPVKLEGAIWSVDLEKALGQQAADPFLDVSNCEVISVDRPTAGLRKALGVGMPDTDLKAVELFVQQGADIIDEESESLICQLFNNEWMRFESLNI